MYTKKFFNEPGSMTDEMLEGLHMVMENYIDVDGHVVSRKGLKDDPRRRVTAMTIGGSGHEPSSLGFVGPGWECVKVLGDVFAAPGPAAIIEGIRIADKGEGILFYVGNHAGDVMNANMALKMAKKQGINIEMVIFHDDVSSYPREEKEQRRGMICNLGLGKVIGSACDSGRTLDKVKEIALRFIDNTASIAVATSGATHPVSGQMISAIPQGKMIIGMGQHGEGSGLQQDIKKSRDTVEIMSDMIINDLSLRSGDKVLLVINGVGSTTYMELMILFKDTYNYLRENGIEVGVKIVGEYLTTQEQAGFQMSMTKIDNELTELLKYPCVTAFKRQLY